MKLNELIETYSTKSWGKIAQFIPPRTARQCRDRWFNYLDPNLSCEPWTQYEDSILIKLQGNIGNHWKQMKKFLPKRSSNNIKQTWLLLKTAINIQNAKLKKQFESNIQAPTYAQTTDNLQSNIPTFTSIRTTDNFQSKIPTIKAIQTVNSFQSNVPSFVNVQTANTIVLAPFKLCLISPGLSQISNNIKLLLSFINT